MPDFDVVVVGAGIHGAGVAQAAVAAGYSVLLLEQYEEVARGSSSKSSKLIHGGLRYLESGEFSLVYECLRERARLLKIAPGLVRLVPFHIPVYHSTSRRPWEIRIGLLLYSLFSGKRFHQIPADQWSRLDGLKTEGLQAVFSYYDAQTNDALLTQAVVLSAKNLGASVVMGALFEKAELEADSCCVTYSQAGKSHNVVTRIMVNATGPWVNQVLDRVVPLPPQTTVELVQGTHIILPGQVSHPYYLEAPQDGRVVFVIPWEGKVMVGTTENNYTGDPAKVVPLDSEINYLLEVYRHYFNEAYSLADVISHFSGLRVLPGGGGAIFRKSRDTRLELDRPARPRVITIYGGKLTSYRATAEKVIHQLRAKGALPVRKKRADTRKLKLPIVDEVSS